MPAASYGALTWGYNKPGCFLWARVLPHGRIYIQADYKFSQTPVELVATEILKRTDDLGITRLHATYADPELFEPFTEDKKPRVEAIATTFRRFGLPMHQAPADSIQGWQRVHDYLRAAPDGQPWLIVSPAAKTLIRTIPTLIQDEHDPDKCEGLAYAANALRFLVASRPLPGQAVEPPPDYPVYSLGWLKQLDRRKNPDETDFGLHRI